MNITEFRAQYPGVYDDLSDEQVADGLWRNHYSDLPRAQVFDSLGVSRGWTGAVTDAAGEFGTGAQQGFMGTGADIARSFANMVGGGVAATGDKLRYLYDPARTEPVGEVMNPFGGFSVPHGTSADALFDATQPLADYSATQRAAPNESIPGTVGRAFGTVGAYLPTILGGAALGAGKAATSLGGAFGYSLPGTGTRLQDLTDQGASLEDISQAAAVNLPINTGMGLLPVAPVASLPVRAAVGGAGNAALGAGGRYAEGMVLPENLQQPALDPTAMGTDALLGAFMGALLGRKPGATPPRPGGTDVPPVPDLDAAIAATGEGRQTPPAPPGGAAAPGPTLPDMMPGPAAQNSATGPANASPIQPAMPPMGGMQSAAELGVQFPDAPSFPETPPQRPTRTPPGLPEPPNAPNVDVNAVVADIIQRVFPQQGAAAAAPGGMADAFMGPQAPDAAQQTRPRKTPGRTINEYLVTLEDRNEWLPVRVFREADGSAVIFDDTGAAHPVEYNSDFARGKTDDELLAYTYEPLGYRGATKQQRRPPGGPPDEPPGGGGAPIGQPTPPASTADAFAAEATAAPARPRAPRRKAAARPYSEFPPIDPALTDTRTAPANQEGAAPIPEPPPTPPAQPARAADFDAPVPDGSARSRRAGSRQPTQPEPGAAPSARSQRAQTLQSHADRTVTGWKNAPRITVTDTVAEWPEEIRSYAQPTDEGVYHKGHVYMAAANIPTADRFARVLSHEMVGHAGIRGLMGDKAQAMLDGVHNDIAAGKVKFDPEFARKHGLDLKRIAKDYGYDLAKPVDRARAAEEYLARLAESGKDSTILDRAIVAVLNFLREKFGADIKWTKSDALELLRESRKFLKEAEKPKRGVAARERNKVMEQPFRETSAARSRREAHEAFYSQLLRTIETAKQPNATPEQWLALMRKSGVKKEEMDWLGIEDVVLRDRKTISRDELAEFVRDNQVTVKEVLKGKSEGFNSEMLARLDELERNPDKTEEEYAEYQRLINEENAVTEPGGLPAVTKHDQWQTPGGKNYRELLITLPAKTGEENFLGSHFSEPNIVAHIRFNERTDADGKRTLFVEEVQSDWHQKGRELGYREGGIDSNNLKRLWDETNTILQRHDYLGFESANQARRAILDNADWADRWDLGDSDLYEGDRTTLENWRAARLHAYRHANTIPDAPFKKSWPLLGMKHAIKWAVENGFDSVAWTPGGVQADRYNLSKDVKRIVVSPHFSELGKNVSLDLLNGDVITFDVNEDGLITYVAGGAGRFDSLKNNTLSDVIGKDMADKVMTTGRGTFDAADLKVGGEGMRGFYDRILPAEINKYIKKWGAKVDTMGVGDGNQRRAEVMQELYDDGEINEDKLKAAQEQARRGMQAHGFTITDAMRESVMQGQPLFSRAKTEDKPAHADFPRQRVRRLIDRHENPENQRETSAFFGRIPIKDFLSLTTTNAKNVEDIFREGPIREVEQGRTESGSRFYTYQRKGAKERFDPKTFDDVDADDGPTLYVTYGDDPGVAEVTGHEGRHRSAMLYRDGARDVPVRIVTTDGSGMSRRSWDFYEEFPFRRLQAQDFGPGSRGRAGVTVRAPKTVAGTYKNLDAAHQALLKENEPVAELDYNEAPAMSRRGDDDEQANTRGRRGLGNDARAYGEEPGESIEGARPREPEETSQRGDRRATGRGAAEKSLAAPVPLDQLDGGTETQKNIYGRFGDLSETDSTESLKFYNLDKLVDAPQRAVNLLKKLGYGIKYFSFHDDPAAGVKFTIPRLKTQGYDQGNVWIYDPRVAHGSFKDVEYTRQWRLVHEAAHGITEPFMAERYGSSRRHGRLGREMQSKAGKPPKQTTITLRPLTLEEAQRAVEWEDVAFRGQRALMEKLGLDIPEETFAQEYNTNISDAVYRVTTGDFGNPGEYGFAPHQTLPDLREVLRSLERTEEEIARSQGREPTRGVDLDAWEPVSDADIAQAIEDRLNGDFDAPSRSTRPDDLDAKHWSQHGGLKKLERKYHGTGIPGEEARRRRTDPRTYQPRLYFGFGPYQKESGLGPHVYKKSINKNELYDISQDAELEGHAKAVRAKLGYFDATEFENAILDAGYKGYYDPKKGVVVYFDDVEPDSYEQEPAFSRRKKQEGKIGELGTRIGPAPLESLYDRHVGEPLWKAAKAIADNTIGKLSGELRLIDRTSPEFKQMLRRMRSNVLQAGIRAADVAKAGVQLSAEERKLISDYIEDELAAGVVPPERVTRTAATMIAALREQGEELVRLGMLTRASRDRWGDEYLPRYYGKHIMNNPFDKVLRAAMKKIDGSHLKGRGLFETVKASEVDDYLRMGWELRDEGQDVDAMDLGDKILMWRDFTPEERQRMGEVRDGVYRYSRGYIEIQKDIAMGRLFEELVDKGIAKENPADATDVRLPTDAVPGTAGVKRYGLAAGKWVPEDVYQHLNALHGPSGELMSAYLKALSWWKEGKTVLNPVVHGNNIFSNFVMADIAGLNLTSPDTWRLWRQAWGDYRKKGPLYQEAIKEGLFGTEFYGQEIRDMMPDLDKLVSPDEIATGVMSKMSNFLLNKTGVRKYREIMGKAYQQEDQIFKLWLYAKLREEGVDAAEAVPEVEKWFFNYADVPQGVRNIKNFALPFFSYVYKAAPALAYAWTKTPWRMAKWAALFGGMNWMAYNYALDGDDEELERSLLPEYMAGRTPLGVPKAMRLPMNDKGGNPMFMDLSRRFPMGDLFDANNQAGGIPMLAPITPNNPILTLMAGIIYNKDSFTGQEVVRGGIGDVDHMNSRKLGALGGWVFRQLAPNTPILPYSYSWDKVMNGIANASGEPFLGYTGKDYYGRETTLPRAAIDTLAGFKVRAIDLKQEQQFRLADVKRDAGQVRAEMNRVVRDKRISEENKVKRMNKLRAELKDVIGDLDEIPDVP